MTTVHTDTSSITILKLLDGGRGVGVAKRRCTFHEATLPHRWRNWSTLGEAIRDSVRDTSSFLTWWKQHVQ